MTPWPARVAFDVLVVGKRLGILLLVVMTYYIAAGVVIQLFRVGTLDLGRAGSLTNLVILGLLMGLRNRAAYERWWEARGLWGQLTNDTRNLAAKCAAFVPADALARSRVASLLVIFPEALKHHLRNTSFRLRDFPGFEHEAEDPPHVPLYLARRLFAIVADWKRDGHIDQGVLWVLDAHARGLLDVCGACEKIRNTPLSPSYKSLLRAGLALNVLFAPWLIVPESGFWSLPVVLLACFFLCGVELIDSILEEPFGHERDDLDLDRYCRTIREGVEGSLPPPPDRPPEPGRGVEPARGPGGEADRGEVGSARGVAPLTDDDQPDREHAERDAVA
jgi:putative membrane protein